MTDRLSDEVREHFTAELSGWGLSTAEIDETLEGTSFSFGLVELAPEPAKHHPEIAIVVDDRRDPELSELFDWRESSANAAVDPEWEPPLIRVILGADEQALLRLGVTIVKPNRVERRFLLSVNVDAKLLTLMQISGTGIWLAASSRIQREAARGGPSDVYDLRSHCLLVGRVADPIESLDEALAHIGAPRSVEEEPPAT